MNHPISQSYTSKISSDSLQALAKLIDDHWAYIRSLLVAHGFGENCAELNFIEFHYRTAFAHGYKHAMEDYHYAQSFRPME